MKKIAVILASCALMGLFASCASTKGTVAGHSAADGGYVADSEAEIKK